MKLLTRIAVIPSEAELLLHPNSELLVDYAREEGGVWVVRLLEIVTAGKVIDLGRGVNVSITPAHVPSPAPAPAPAPPAVAAVSKVLMTRNPFFSA